MKVAIRRSGYLLEQRVAATIRDNGYHVETNPSFKDPLTGKSREYDVSAVIVFDLLGRKRKIDFLWFHILCECENNEQPVVFFEDEPADPDLIHLGIVCSGLPLRFRKRNQTVDISEFLHFDGFHHSWKWPCATQYCSFQRKHQNAPWIALHDEAHHATVTNLLAALECEIDEHYGLLEKGRFSRDTASVSVYYPLLVLGGPLYLARESKRGLVLHPRSYLQYKKETWVGERRSEYRVDVIQEGYVPRYLRILEKELREIRKAAEMKKVDFLLGLTRELDKLSPRRKSAPIRILLDPRFE
ncbi:MAG: hypothetical protein ABSE19_12050 [Candidatus Acidiferrum sp.]|jgi:hypothetical protein